MTNWVDTGAGLILPEDVALERARKAKPPTGVDLFSGVGGMSLGAIKAGFEIVCAVDNDVYASLTYLTNLGQWPMRIEFVTDKDRKRFEKGIQKQIVKAKHAPDDGRGEWIKSDILTMPVAGQHRPTGQVPVRSFLFGDVREVTGDLIAEVSGVPLGDLHCVFGGPPCQGYSTSGKRNVMDPRNSLVFEMARLICELQPQTMVFENVPGITTMVTPEGVPVLDQFCHILSEGGWAGYDAMRKMMSGSNPDLAGAFKGGRFDKGKTKKPKKDAPKRDDSQQEMFEETTP